MRPVQASKTTMESLWTHIRDFWGISTRRITDRTARAHSKMFSIRKGRSPALKAFTRRTFFGKTTPAHGVQAHFSTQSTVVEKPNVRFCALVTKRFAKSAHRFPTRNQQNLLPLALLVVWHGGGLFFDQADPIAVGVQKPEGVRAPRAALGRGGNHNARDLILKAFIFRLNVRYKTHLCRTLKSLTCLQRQSCYPKSSSAPVGIFQNPPAECSYPHR